MTYNGHSGITRTLGGVKLMKPVIVEKSIHKHQPGKLHDRNHNTTLKTIAHTSRVLLVWVKNSNVISRDPIVKITLGKKFRKL